MLIAMSMKMTALNHTQGKYLSPQWQRLIMSVIHWINLPSTAPSTCSLRQKKIAFFGLGSSAAVAHDAMNKFFRFNVPVVYSDDIVLQRMSCMNCSDGDVVVLISHTGRTKKSGRAGAAGTRKRRHGDCPHLCGYPARPEATLAITLDVPEDTDIYMPMVSRLAQLTVIDVLATGFTLRRGAKFRDNLKRVKEALKESRFDKQLLNLSDDR
ncbi:SIS domain-containing protein [Escherichia coli]|nr:SIS domain-containing protein [Escherichia coli]